MKARLLSVAAGLLAGWLVGQAADPGATDPPGAPSQDSSRAESASTADGRRPSQPVGGEIDPGGGDSMTGVTAQTRIRQLVERLSHARAGDFPAIWEEAFAEDDAARGRMEFPMSRQNITYLIMHEWVTRDADGAREYIESATADGADGSGGKLEIFMTAWLAVDPAAATKLLTTTSWDDLNGGLHRALARHDPQLALAHWQASSEPGSAVPSTILREIATIDPHAAFDLLTPADGEPPGKRAVASIIRGWPVERLDELLPRLYAHVDQFPTTDLESSFRSIGGLLARDGNLGEGLDWILSQDDPGLRKKILQGLLQQQQPIDQGALERIAALPPEELLAFDNFGDVLKANMDDRAAAWDWLQSLPPDVQEKALASGGISDFARNWALIDLEAAFGMAGSIPDTNASAIEDLAEGLARASGERHPLEGLALASQLPAELRSEFAQTLAKSWSGYDAEGFMEHLESMPDGAQLEALQRGGFRTIAAQSPERAGELLLDLFDTDAERTKRAGELINAWVIHDPNVAAGWVSQLPDGVHDDAAGKLGDALADSDPIAAAEAYLSISDPEARLPALQDHYNSLAGYDRSAADELVRTTPMDESMRQELLDGIEASAAQD